MVTQLVNRTEQKPKVLVLADWYRPAMAGGAARTIESIVHHLGGDVTFRILTGDRDLGCSVPLEGVVVDDWQRVGKADVFYASPERLKAPALRRLLNGMDYDILYLNSFFSYRFAIVPLLLYRFGLIRRRPVVLAPRGEFSLGALKLKFAKKRYFIWLSKFFGLYRNIIWQASSEFEVEDIQKCFPKVGNSAGDNSTIHVAPDLSVGAVEKTRKRQTEKTPGSLNIIFLSRISPMKNLDYALKVVSRMRGKVSFDIYGPIDEEKDTAYWAKCQQLIKKMPASVEVSYKGIIEPNRVWEMFSQYDVFLFPTRGENFGHVILESLAAGCPVLLSDETPWRNLDEKEAGWVVPLAKPEAFQTVLEKLVDMGEGELEAISQRAKQYASDAINDPVVLEQNRLLFCIER